MSTLKLVPGPQQPGPQLLLTSWEDRNWVATDVTDRANEFLFQPVEVDPRITLADVFALVIDDPIMQQVFRQEFVQELCAEVRKGPRAAAQKEAWDEIEYLELYQVWNLNTFSQKYVGVGQYEFHGIGPVLTDDVLQDDWVMYRKGNRITWGVSCTPVREMLHLPIRVNPTVTICEDDMDSKHYGREIATGTHTTITLGTFIREILWELSWHGTPADIEKVVETLTQRAADIQSGTVETISEEDVFEQLGFVSRKVIYQQLFDQCTQPNTDVLDRAICDVEDTELVTVGLARLLGRDIAVKVEYAQYTGREFRKLIRDLRH
jgi:hypothetical protein